MDMTMGIVLLALTGFLWLAGAILHWHNIRRQEKLLARMRRMSLPHDVGALRGRGRRKAHRAEGADERLLSGPLTR
jgi:hypothetical protein